MTVELTKKDIQFVRRLRGCLTNKTVDFGALDELLSSLEGKVIPTPMGSSKRKNVRSSRVERHFQNIVSGL